MKVAVIGSRSITSYPLEGLIPAATTEIISGGARGADAIAREYAQQHDIPLTEIRPDYARYGKGAPLRRNLEIMHGRSWSSHCGMENPPAQRRSSPSAASKANRSS